MKGYTRKKEKYQGFTFIETMLVVFILAVLTAVGIISLKSSRESYYLNAAQREVSSAFRLAHSYALQGKTLPSGNWGSGDRGACKTSNCGNDKSCYTNSTISIKNVSPIWFGVEFFDEKTFNVFASRYLWLNGGLYYDALNCPYPVEAHELKNGVKVEDPDSNGGTGFDEQGVIGRTNIDDSDKNRVNWVIFEIPSGEVTFQYTDPSGTISTTSGDYADFKLTLNGKSKYVRLHKSGLIEEKDGI